MNEKLILESNLEEIKKGYKFKDEKEEFSCLICGEKFIKGQIYSINGRFYEAYKAVAVHVKEKHGEMLNILIDMDKKYTGITDNQKKLLIQFYNGLSDKKIAEENGVSSSTIRHQKFIFREKAKQAKTYLAIFDLAQSSISSENEDELVKIHSGAKMVDERYIITNEEQQDIINRYFSSINPLTLKSFPTKEKRKIAVLREISALFSKGKKYSEKEVNLILSPVYEDIATIRRYLIEYGFMDRTRDCSEYWVKE